MTHTINDWQSEEEELTELAGHADQKASHFIKKTRGRAPKPIDEEKLKAFLAVNMPIKRIADYFNITREQLYRRYSDLIVESNVEFEYQLRLSQLKAANEMNPTMLIWLGKQVLGQSDEQKVTVEQKPSVSDIQFVPIKKDE